MAGLLPSEYDAEFDEPEGDPRVVGVDSADADEVLGALSSGTARRLLTALHEEPATPSELANRIDTSLQNTQYHIEKLVEADLIEVTGTRYSAKGREMNVYAPTDGPLVLFAGDEEESAGVQAALAQLLGGIGVISAAGGVVKWWVARSGGAGSVGPGEGPMGVAPDAATAASAPSQLTTAQSGGSAALVSVEAALASLPGLAMAAIGLLLVLAIFLASRK
ncbi:MAG: ArsR/SmtB family transcription factor [Halobacteriaceae archaeon]